MNDLRLTPTGLRFAGRLIPCTLGRTGITTDKREGDGATPAGLMHVTGMLYRPDRLNARALPHWAQPIGLRDLWCDDPAHPAYNHPARAPLNA
ncbi:MAG: L,D-transpeptidase family protein, partial [Pararhodobacter sp.]